MSPFAMPSLPERRRIALLMLAGQQFEEIRASYHESDTDMWEYGIHAVLNQLKYYMEMADYVNLEDQPLCISLAVLYKKQIEKLEQSIGTKNLQLADSHTTKQLCDKGVFHRFNVEVDKVINTIFPTKNIPKMEKISLYRLCIKEAVNVLSQPNLKLTNTKDEEGFGKRTAAKYSYEDPCTSFRPMIKPARARRISSSESECEIKLMSSDDRREVHDMKLDESTYIVRSLALKDMRIEQFHDYCRKKDANMLERWTCSRSIHSCFWMTDSNHAECVDQVNHEKREENNRKSADEYFTQKRRFYREFGAVMISSKFNL